MVMVNNVTKISFFNTIQAFFNIFAALKPLKPKYDSNYQRGAYPQGPETFRKISPRAVQERPAVYPAAGCG